jgi:hypothetical protein
MRKRWSVSSLSVMDLDSYPEVGNTGNTPHRLFLSRSHAVYFRSNVVAVTLVPPSERSVLCRYGFTKLRNSAIAS